MSLAWELLVESRGGGRGDLFREGEERLRPMGGRSACTRYDTNRRESGAKRGTRGPFRGSGALAADAGPLIKKTLL